LLVHDFLQIENTECIYSYQREAHAKSSHPVWHHSRLHHPGIFKEAPTLPLKHRLQARRRPTVQDFEGEILIAYPVAEKRIDLIREVLCPAKIGFERRTAELTVAILQLVASRRRLAALPNWSIKNYINYGYMIAKRIGYKGMWSDLHVSVPSTLETRPFIANFVNVGREQCAAHAE
jgi:LysR family transcriptional regulator for metE and metH